VSQLICSVDDEHLYECVVNGTYGNACQELANMIGRLGCSIQNVEVLNPKYLTEDGLIQRFTADGPGLVTSFISTDEFRMGCRQYPAFDQSSDAEIGILQVQMRNREDVNRVKGVFRVLKAQSGSDTTVSDDIQARIQAAKQKTETNAFWFDPPSETRSTTGMGGRGDSSAPLYSPQTSLDSIRSVLSDSRDLQESAEDISNGETSSWHDHDHPPADVHDEDDPSEVQHSFVCIAARSENGTLSLLLQNSWPKMLLVEVSIEYFIAAEGQLAFVDKK